MFIFFVQDLNFEKTKSHEINDELSFTRYKSNKKDGTLLNLLVNQSKKGYLVPSKKSVNYFLIINKKNFKITIRNQSKYSISYENKA